MQAIVAQPASPQLCFGSDIPRVQLLMQGTGESAMGQDQGCRLSDSLSPIQNDKPYLV